MHIGILQAGHVPEPLQPEHGDYPALYARLLAGHGMTFHAWPVCDGIFPPGPRAADGWLITGSRHGAYEPHPWIPPLEALIRDISAAGRPMIGICFGHQIVAQALGGTVEKAAGGWSIGRSDYPWQDESRAGGHGRDGPGGDGPRGDGSRGEGPRGDGPRGRGPRGDGSAADTSSANGPSAVGEGSGEPLALNAWHQDQVTRPPSGARTLSATAHCPHAALAYGRTILTVQPHPEFDHPFIDGLIRTRGRGTVPDAVLDRALREMGRPLDNARMGGILGRHLLAAHRAASGSAAGVAHA